MGKRIGKILAWVGAIAFALFTIGVVLAMIFEDEIGEKLLKSLNSQIKSEITVGEFELSLFSGFPEASAELNDVLILDTWSGELLRAKKVAFRFRLLSLFSSTIDINSVLVRDGQLNIKVGKRGGNNYTIFKSTGETNESEMAIDLKEAMLRQIDVYYLNDQLQQEFKTEVKSANFSGQFASDKFSLVSDASLFNQFAKIEKDKYFENKSIGYEGEILVDFAKGEYDIKQLNLTLGGQQFSADGFIQEFEDYTDLDILITSEENDINAVLQLLPEEYLAYVADFKSRGNFDFEATINGKYNQSRNPVIKLDISLKDGEISSSKLETDLEDVSFSAQYSNGKERNNASSSFVLKDFKGYFNRELVDMELDVRNFDDMRVDFDFGGTVPLNAVYGLMGSPSITDGDGEVEIQDFKLKGRYKDMVTPSRIGKVQTSGTIAFDDAALTINDELLMIDRGVLQIKNNEVRVKQVKLESTDTEFTLDGSIQNLVPVLFSDSLNTKKAKLKFNLNLEAPEIDIDRLMRFTEIEIAESEVSEAEFDSLQVAKVEQREHIVSYLDGTFNATVGKFNYEKINGRSFKGKLIFKGDEVDLIGEAFAMEGSFEVDGRMYFNEEPHLKAKLICQEINVTDFLEQTDNLGQDVLTYENLSGSLNAKIAIDAFWNKEGEFLEDELYVIAALGLQEGTMKDFKMMDSFADYVNIRDLRNIRFSNMQNWIEIKKRRLNLPIMFLQNNALNLTLNGKYTFDHDFDFNVKVNAGQAMVKLFKKHDPSLKPLPAKKNGLFNLYYKIYGDFDKYKFKSAKQEIKKDFQRSEYKKRVLKEALIAEFGDIEVIYEDETADKNETPSRQTRPTQADLDYWEDEEPTGSDGDVFLDEIEGGSGNE